MTRRVLGRVVGAVAMVACIVFLALQLRGELSELWRTGLSAEDGLRLALAVGIYSVALTCQHAGWGLLAASARGDARRAVEGGAISAKAAIGKYLPGNVAHLAGRQVLGARRGWPHAASAAGSILETLALIIASGLVIVCGAVFGVGAMSAWSWWHLVVVGGLVACLLVGSVLAWTHPRLAPIRDAIRATRSVLLPVLGSYLGFVVFGAVAQAVLFPDAPLGKVVVVASTAWLVGYLSPGVPAGIGVREAVFTVGFAADSTQLALAVVGFRVVTIVADLLMSVVGSLMLPSVPAAVPVPDRVGA